MSTNAASVHAGEQAEAQLQATLRFAVAVTAAFVVCEYLQWTPSFLAPVLVAALLGNLPMRLPLKLGLILIVTMAVASTFAFVLASLLRLTPVVLFGLIGLCIFLAFYAIARGKPAFPLLLLLICLLIVPVMVMVAPAQAGAVPKGLTRGILVAVVMIWTVYLPWPHKPPPKPASATAPGPATPEALAMVSTAVLLPLVLVYLLFGLSDVLPVMMGTLMLVISFDLRSSRMQALGMILGNFAGGLFGTAVVPGAADHAEPAIPGAAVVPYHDLARPAHCCRWTHRTGGPDRLQCNADHLRFCDCIGAGAVVTVAHACVPVRARRRVRGGHDDPALASDLARQLHDRRSPQAVDRPRREPGVMTEPASVAVPDPPPAAATVSFALALRVWAKIGLLGFGGPAGQIALMHRELVEQRRWISESRFLHALNYCMLLPGPEAQQLAVYIGWLMHRTWGGVVAGALFVLPGALVLGVLSWLYVRFGSTPVLSALFFGLKAAVLAVVVEAVLRIGRRALKTRFLVALAVAAFAAIFAFQVPFPWIVFGAAITGLGAHRWRPAWLPAVQVKTEEGDLRYVVDRQLARGDAAHLRPSLKRTVRTTLACAVLWLAPVACAAWWLGHQHVIAQEGLFFSQAAVVTFGGAYAVLAYVAQRAVEDFRWLGPGEMIEGLALAETTPGPLILVLQFVGFIAAYRHPGTLDPLTAALLGAALTTWVTFVPSFLFIFVGAPYIEALRQRRELHAALSAITAAVVGVVMNLAVWFALHTVFQDVVLLRLGPLALEVPVLASIDLGAALLAIAAMFAMLRLKLGLGWTLLGSALLGSAYWWVAH